MKMSGRTDGDFADGLKQEERLLSKLVSKENSRAGSSSRVYYYGGATVPFLWETRPGTPKHTLCAESSHLPPPPLTPPPSYFSSGKSMQRTHKVVKTKQPHFLATFFHLRKANRDKNQNCSRPTFSWSSTSSSVSSSSSTSSSSSSPSPGSSNKIRSHRKKCYLSLSCSSSPLPYVKNDEESAEEENLRLSTSSSPISTLCYRSFNTGGKRGFSSSMESLKRALFSVRSHGSKGQ